MKKNLLALLLALSLLTLAGCSNTNTEDTTDTNDTTVTDTQVPDDGANMDGEETTPAEDAPTTDDTAAYSSAVELYTLIWDNYGEDNKFAVGGGDMDNMAEAPALYRLTDENKESFQYLLHVSEDQYAMLEDDVATLQHMMNTNTFCSAVAKLKEPDKAADFAESYKTTVQAQQWMCGFPDTVVVISMGDYVVMAYGMDDNITNLITACQAVDAGATVLVQAPATVD